MARVGLVLPLLVLAAACVRPPKPLTGEFAAVTPGDARSSTPVGARVRWGGEIVSTSPKRSRTCFQIVSLPLDGAARPARSDETYGRFIACARGFYDPAIYAPEREVTVVGTVTGTTPGSVGEHEYEFPRVDADVVHLWPRRPREEVVYRPYYWGAAWDPFWHPYWGFGLGWGFRVR
jgi:outer membrane lipoprotein